MNIRYGHSSLARAIASVSLAASIIGSAGFASAKVCDFDVPTSPQPCQEGTSTASVSHSLGGIPARYTLSVNWLGGTSGAVAYGIDANGNHLSTCAKTAADDDNGFGTSPVPCSQLYSTPGTASPTVEYDHPIDVVTTHVVVI